MIKKLRIVLTMVCIFATIVLSCTSQQDIEQDISFDEYVDIANRNIHDGNIEKAIAALNNALKLNPEDSQTHYWLGTIYLSEWQKSLETAKKKYLIDAFKFPDKRASKDMIKEYEKFGLKSELRELAMQEFKKSARLNPDNWRARYNIGADYRKKERYLESIRVLKEVIKLNTNHKNSYSLIGKNYFDLGDYEKSAEYLMRALELEHDSEYDYYYLGMAYRKMNKSDELKEVLAKLKAMDSIYYDRLRHKLFQKP